MELAEKTVYDFIAAAEKTNRALTENEILKIFKDTIYGVKEMHDLGIIHQDLKVENILLANGVAKLCDLGSCSTEKIDLETVPKSKIYHYE